MKRLSAIGAIMIASFAMAELEVPADLREAIEAEMVVCAAYPSQSEIDACVDEAVKYYSRKWELRHRSELAAAKQDEVNRERQRRDNMKSQWELSTSIDALTDRESKTISLISDNTHRFRFPYNKDNHMVLQIREHPRFGQDIILRIVDGQFACYSTRCDIHFRFDGGSIVTVQGNTASDGNSSVIFVTNRDRRRILNSIINAEKIIISTTLYNAGNPAFEFTVKK